MITDEQINRAIEIIKLAERHNVQVCLDEFKKVGQHVIPPEQFVRQLLNDYEQSKWVKFDVNNPATYPQAGAHAFRYIVRTTNGVQKITIIAHWNGRYWFANQQYIDVTHWQPLPELKE